MPMVPPEAFALVGFEVVAGEIDPLCPYSEVVVGAPFAAEPGVSPSDLGNIILLQ